MMLDFRKYYLALTLISATLGGCSGGGDDGPAVAEPSSPPAATPAVNAGDVKMLSKMILSVLKLLSQVLAVTHHSATAGAESTAPT